ncbi:unnamed protein product [Miscanthus lutarioriparius]|uniref:Sialate O-acetylesterase domain-containing protein n=1 Tax=Miscanthus lutarioriparius TaxID=422564 RepID=A0A811NQ93_9POAL|nr:unnamed protein product [Miscanthus lutarioriparius]
MWAILAMLRPALALPFLLLLLPAAAGGLSGGRTLVFILAGQSNMSGRGGATNGTWDGIVPPECAPSERILRLSPALRWEEAREPLHAGIDVGNVVGIGPGMPFAHAVLAGSEGAESVVGLVPCAQGGTPIANWSRGTELYERMVTRARAAVAECSGRGELVGIATAQYNGKFLDLVREAQKAVTLPNVKYVDAMGLPIASDHTHLTTEAQIQLGNKLAKSYLETL